MMLSILLFISSSLNANAVVADPYACWDVADTTVSAFQEANIKLHHIATYQQEYNVWVAAYDGCMGN